MGKAGEAGACGRWLRQAASKGKVTTKEEHLFGGSDEMMTR